MGVFSEEVGSELDVKDGVPLVKEGPPWRDHPGGASALEDVQVAFQGGGETRELMSEWRDPESVGLGAR